MRSAFQWGTRYLCGQENTRFRKSTWCRATLLLLPPLNMLQIYPIHSMECPNMFDHRLIMQSTRALAWCLSKGFFCWCWCSILFSLDSMSTRRALFEVLSTKSSRPLNAEKKKKKKNEVRPKHAHKLELVSGELCRCWSMNQRKTSLKH